VGRALVRLALEEIRRRSGTVTAVCSFVVAFLDENPEFGDLIDPQHQGAIGTGQLAAGHGGRSYEESRMTGGHVSIDPDQMRTRRLVLRAWSPDDSDDAFRIYGNSDVARWLAPAIHRVPDVGAMREVLVGWIADSYARRFPQGRWAIERREDGAVIGGAELLPLGDTTHLFMGWQLQPAAWGYGFAAEAGHALAHQVFELDGVDEVFAVAHPRNLRGRATALRIGMTHVGETTAVGGATLGLYRLGRGDLHLNLPGVSPESGYNPIGLNDW
jgi:RimJ/RimL family protein N-acetyltransferase